MAPLTRPGAIRPHFTRRTLPAMALALAACGNPASTQTSKANSPASQVSSNALLVDNIPHRVFSFSNETVTPTPEGSLLFEASDKKDPGFGIEFNPPLDLEGRTTFKFVMRGTYESGASWGRVIAQAYMEGNGSYTPDRELDPVNVSEDWAPFQLLLESGKKLAKVQFLVVGPDSSCELEVGNVRFE